jgi:hypothetical protein
MWMLAAMSVFGLVMTGCNKDTSGPEDESAPNGVATESQARAYYANNDEFVNNDERTIDDQEMQPTDYGTFGKINAEITPLRWGRFVRQVVRTVRDTVLPGDSIAFVHIHKVISGNLRIRGINGAGDTIEVTKPFTDEADRVLIFKRVNDRRFWLRWVPVATSLVAGATPTPNNINITQVELISRNDTITITDPLNFFLRYHWNRLNTNRSSRDVPTLDPGAMALVRATVVSASADTDLVALRFGVGTFFKRRMRMQCISEVNNGNGTFTRVFQANFPVHLHRGWFHSAVDAATRETLFDDQAPYSVSWWGVPYRVF